MYNVSKWSDTLPKSCSECCKIFKSMSDHFKTFCINGLKLQKLKLLLARLKSWLEFWINLYFTLKISMISWESQVYFIKCLRFIESWWIFELRRTDIASCKINNRCYWNARQGSYRCTERAGRKWNSESKHIKCLVKPYLYFSFRIHKFLKILIII